MSKNPTTDKHRDDKSAGFWESGSFNQNVRLLEKIAKVRQMGVCPESLIFGMIAQAGYQIDWR